MMQSFNRMTDYIERHLNDELTDALIVQVTGISAFHFRKTFLFMTGITLNHYVKQRRFSIANQDLIAGETVTDTAFKFGYQSIEGFSRSFKEWSGYLPSEVKEKQLLKHYSKLTCSITIQGGETMDVKIETKPAFNLVGVTKRVAMQFEGENQQIIELAKTITVEQREQLQQYNDLYPHQVINASYDFDEGRLNGTGELTHMIGFVSEKEAKQAEFSTVKVPSHTWAVFTCKGAFPEVLQATWAKIYSEWLPSNPYELVNEPEISFSNYAEPMASRTCEIWLAVKRTGA